MNNHFALIAEYCEVIETIADKAIYFIEDGEGYAEINGASFSCHSLEEFHDLWESFKEETFEE